MLISILGGGVVVMVGVVGAVWVLMFLYEDRKAETIVGRQI